MLDWIFEHDWIVSSWIVSGLVLILMIVGILTVVLLVSTLTNPDKWYDTNAPLYRARYEVCIAREELTQDQCVAMAAK